MVTDMDKLFDLYPIVNGCSTECVFSGTFYDCQAYALGQRDLCPDFDYILLPYGF